MNDASLLVYFIRILREGDYMNMVKLSVIFKFVILGIFYIILFLALRIMYKDIKNGGSKKQKRHTLGLEIIEPGNSVNLKKGGVIPVHGEITLGRKQDNLFILDDPYVSGHHAKIYPTSNGFFIEDMGSTNGTLLNDQKVTGRANLISGDIIKVGSTVLKVIS